MNNQPIVLTINGCRGSYSVGGNPFCEIGGLTSSILLEVAGKKLFFDAGSGLSSFSHSNNPKNEGPYYFFLTHFHLDHIAGLVSFSPLYCPDSKIHFFGPSTQRFQYVEDAISALLSPPFHPLHLHEMKSQKMFYTFQDGDFIFFDENSDAPLYHSEERAKTQAPTYPISIQCIHNKSHPKSGVTLFLIHAYGRKIVYATDFEGKIDDDPRIATFLKDCDLLIHDATYTRERYNDPHFPTKGYGHSTIDFAVEIASRAQVKQLLLFHHDPSSDDQQLKQNLHYARSRFPNTDLAQQGAQYFL